MTDSLMFPLRINDLIDKDSSKDKIVKDSFENQKTQVEEIKKIRETEEGLLNVANVKKKEDKKKEKKETIMYKLHEKFFKMWNNVNVPKVFNALLKGIGNIAITIKNWVWSFIGSLLDLMFYAAVDSKGGLIKGVISILIPLFINMVRFIGSIMMSLIPEIINMFISNIPLIIETVANVINIITEYIPKIIGIIAKSIPIIIDALKKAVPLILNSIYKMIMVTSKELRKHFPLLDPLLSRIEKFVTAIKDLFTNGIGNMEDFIGKSIESFGMALYEIILYSYNEIFSFIDKVKEKLKNKFKGYEKLFDFIEKLAKILTILGGLFLAFKVFFVILKAVMLIIGGIFGFVTSLAFLIVGIVVIIAALIWTYWDDIVGFFRGILDKFKGMISDIESFFKKSIDSFFNYLNQIWNDISGWFAENKQKIFDIFMLIVRAMFLPMNILIYMYKNFDKISNQMNKIVRWFIDFVGKIFGEKFKEKLEKAFEFIKNVNIGQFLYNMASSAIEKAFSNIPALSRIRDFFYDLIKLIENSKLFEILKKGMNFLKQGNEKIELTESLKNKLASSYNIITNKSNVNLITELVQEKVKLDTAKIDGFSSSDIKDLVDLLKSKGITKESKNEDILKALTEINKSIKENNYTIIPSDSSKKSFFNLFSR